MNKSSSNYSEHVQGFAEKLKTRGRQPHTIESYSRDANRFLDYLAKCKIMPNRVEPETLVQYQEFLTLDSKEKENTVRRAVIGVRQFYRFLVEDRVIQSSPFDLVAIPERDEKMPELNYRKLDELLQLVISTSTNLMDARNAAILALIAIEGLKATEVIGLRWPDVFLDSPGSLLIRGTKSRTIALDTITANSLGTYRNCFEELKAHPQLKNVSSHHVFVSFKGRDASILMPSMTRHGLKFIIYELGTKVGLEHLNTEILRHFAVSQLLARGLSAEQIMEHLGLRRIGNIAKHLSFKTLEAK